jgi:uncharacterized protein (DUF2235 family)
MIETMEREALEDTCFPRRASRPGNSLEKEDPRRMMVACLDGTAGCAVVGRVPT